MAGRVGDPTEPGPDWAPWEWQGKRYMVSPDRLYAVYRGYSRWVQREVWYPTGDLLRVVSEGRPIPPPKDAIVPGEDWLPWVIGKREFMIAPDGNSAAECTPSGWVPANGVVVKREGLPATAPGWPKNVVPFFDAAAWDGKAGGVASMANFPGGTRLYLVDRTPVAVIPLRCGRIGARSFGEWLFPRWYPIDRALKEGVPVSRGDFEAAIFAAFKWHEEQRSAHLTRPDGDFSG